MVTMEGHWKNVENTSRYVGQCQGDAKGCWASSKNVCETLGKVLKNFEDIKQCPKNFGAC
jgi:hypothetical protein